MENLLNNPQVALLLVWSLAWKGWALWRSARNNQRYWFVALLVINSVGLMEIVYLTFFQKEGKLWDKYFKKAGAERSEGPKPTKSAKKRK